jgi:hypothetical protein
MRRGCVAFLASSCVAGALFVTLPAGAQQPKGAAAGPSRSSAQFTLRREEPGGPDAQAARSRARAGDCAGALGSFDAAIKNTIDPTLRRDRGLCHEKLGNRFPAIEDYRAYLVAQPDAPDSDQIRQRLAALEDQAGTAPASSGRTKETESPKETGGEASASFSVGGSGASASASASGSASSERPKSGESYDSYVEQEKLADAAESSPLRNGSGVVLGPFVHLPRFFFGDRAPSDLAYGVGLALRYSTGPSLSLISELGYAGIGTSGAASSQAGPLLLGGAELRLPVSRFSGDHILLRGGLGYERYVVSGTRAVSDTLLGRFGVGFRHVFGPSIGLEALVDGGPAYFIPESGSGRFNVVLGGSVAFVVGF